MKMIFVYNNSKMGAKNHERFLTLGSEFISKAMTVGGYSLYAKFNEDFVTATLIKDLGSKQLVKGELYRVPDTDLLDFWEGHPNYFKRVKITVAVESTNTLEEVEAYIFSGELGQAERVVSGNYIEAHHELPIGLVA